MIEKKDSLVYFSIEEVYLLKPARNKSAQLLQNKCIFFPH